MVYVGTFSKTLFPALRVAYLVLPRSLVPAFVAAKWATDRFSATLPQEALTDFITTASSSATCDAPGIGTPRGAAR